MASPFVFYVATEERFRGLLRSHALHELTPKTVDDCNPHALARALEAATGTSVEAWIEKIMEDIDGLDFLGGPLSNPAPFARELFWAVPAEAVSAIAHHDASPLAPIA